jgi:hypothetical protein
LIAFMKSVAKKSLDLTSLFEAEVFVRLMLWRWNHPYADDEEYANGLLESAAEALRSAIRGEGLVEGVPPADMNFVAAVWYAEQCAVETETDITTIPPREAWLIAVRRALPSCFCDPSDLPPT